MMKKMKIYFALKMLGGLALGVTILVFHSTISDLLFSKSSKANLESNVDVTEIGDVRISKRITSIGDTLYSLEKYVYGEVPITKDGKYASVDPHWMVSIASNDFETVKRVFDDLKIENDRVQKVNDKYVAMGNRFWKVK